MPDRIVASSSLVGEFENEALPCPKPTAAIYNMAWGQGFEAERALLPLQSTERNKFRRLFNAERSRTSELKAAYNIIKQSRRNVAKSFSWTPSILYLSGEPSTRAGHVYRVLRFVDALRSAGFQSEWIELSQLDEVLLKQKLRNADALVIWRAPWSEKLSTAISIARIDGIKVVFDIDDYLFDPDLAKIAIRDGIRSGGLCEERVAEQCKSIQQTLKEADYCTCTTSRLASAMRCFSKPTFVLPNGFDEKTIEASRRAAWRQSKVVDGLIRIGYAGGTKTHQRDFAVVAPAIARLLREDARCRLVVFDRALDLSEFPELLGLETHIENRALVPLQDLAYELARFDINVAPLEVGNPFCEAKSELKYFEAALVRVPTVASPTEPFRAAITHGKNGLLASSPDEWYGHLKALAQNPELRRRIGQKAYDHALWRYGPERRLQLVTSAFEQILLGPRLASRRQPDVLRNLADVARTAFGVLFRLMASPFAVLIFRVGLRTRLMRPMWALLPRNKRKRLRDVWLIRRSALFDADWYLVRNPDVAKAGLDPVLHYVRHGAAKGRDPGPLFDTDWYLEQNPSVAKAGQNPLAHYLRRGATQGRRPHPPRCNDISLFGTPGKRPAALQETPKNRHVVYTAIVGHYDELKAPAVIADDWDYICFSDAPIEAPYPWRIFGIDYFNMDPKRVSGYLKTHPHIYLSEYEWSVWVDANIKLGTDPLFFLNVVNTEGARVGSYLHQDRDCLFEEAMEVVRRRKDDAEVVKEHINRYRNERFPRNFGLYETNVLLRKHNDPMVRKLDVEWWKEIDSGSRRDQLSLTYVLWKHDFKIFPFGGKGTCARNVAQAQLVPHNKVISAVNPPGGNTRKYEEIHLRHLRCTSNKHITPSNIDIIVCIHNALDDARRCLAWLVKFSEKNGPNLILVDDGSDQETRIFLESFSSDHANVTLIRNDQACGYTAAANKGLRRSQGRYVILLNSDTVVTSRWVHKMVEAVEVSPDVGLAGPMSNAASWQSVPDIIDSRGGFAVNELPRGITPEDVNRICEQSSTYIFPRVPILNGFCLIVKRRVLDEVGYFDENAFPQGYGEENDYCFRARDAGFECVVATHTYVFHAKSKSYGSERRRVLSHQGSRVLRERYSGTKIKNAVETMRVHPELSRMRESVRLSLANARIAMEANRELDSRQFCDAPPVYAGCVAGPRPGRTSAPKPVGEGIMVRRRWLSSG
jgi:GT2 family glycosyltransferase/glycosyltransferase involved in cell wall biosynthesis